MSSATLPSTRTHDAGTTAFRILAALSFCHLLNDMMQSLVPAVYPILKASYHLDFSQIGMISASLQITASLLQPLVGIYTDAHSRPYSLAIGMGFTLTGLLLLASAPTFVAILFAVAFVGVGSAVFHPESSRIARLASGGQHGLAQSLFQVGGNTGSATGPLLAAFIVLPGGQHSIAWFSIAALIAILILAQVGAWYKRHNPPAAARAAEVAQSALSRRKVALAMMILVALIFSKYIYLASLTSYYTFYLISRFHVSVQSAQIHLFLFLGAVAAGTFAGGPIGDRIGRKYVIWCSILGVLPFTLALPFANLFWTAVLTVIIGLVLASAFSAILVYAQELVPGRVGAISGIFFGLAFGVAGIGAALLGRLADSTSITFVYQLCAFLPALGLLTAFLPNLESRSTRSTIQPFHELIFERSRSRASAAKGQPLKLNGQAAIVTGGASGLGAETARMLARGGAKVGVFDVNLRMAEDVAREIGGLAIKCDVSDATGAVAAIATAHERHGPARILVNCAGIGLGKRIVGRDGPMPLEDYARVIQVNLIGTFNMLRLAAAEMAALDPIGEERGVIVSTASIAAFEGQVGQAAYASSKGGIVALTMPAARELSQFGIRVLTIAPGIFRTPLLQKLPEEVQKSLGESVLFPKRLGEPAEYAAMVEHCIANGYLNGEVIRLDGGLRMAPR